MGALPPKRSAWISVLSVLAVAGSLVGCASGGTVAAERQTCVECALREHPDPETLPDAEAKFSRWCAEGDARSCSVLGVMFEYGRGVERDEQRAAQLYGQSCRQQNARACVSLGHMMEVGTAARNDLAGAMTMYDSACSGGELDGCHALGRLLGDQGELRRAAKVLGRTCKLGHAAACETLGVMAESGRGVAQSANRAQQLFRRACRGGKTEACARL